jgi:hypothetical protein
MATKKEAAAAALVAMVDELGDIEQECQPYRVKIARAEALRAAVRAAFADQAPDASPTADGERWRVLLGPAGNRSVVDIPALFKLIGPGMFSRIATVTVEALRKSVASDVQAAVVSTKPTGPRPITLVPLD